MNEIEHVGLDLKEALPDNWHFGSGKATQRFGGDLNSSGDWRDFHPGEEPQRFGNFDTMGCVIFATLKAWITVATFLGIPLPKNLSERYSGTLGGTTPSGTDPQLFAEKTRKEIGVIPAEFMPNTDDLESWPDFYNQKMAELLLPYGKESLSRYEFGYEWVIAWGSTYTREEKQARIQAALKRGPVCASISGNYIYDNQGRLVHQPQFKDSHWIQILWNNGHSIISDQYEPYIKELEPNYDHNAVMLYFLKSASGTPKPANFFSQIWSSLMKLVWRS